MNRGQAAMEFLMTYGWAILAVLVVVAFLARIGIDRLKFGPELCIAGPGLSCKDFKVQRVTEYGTPDDGRIEINFVNGFGKDISDFFVTIDPDPLKSRYCPGITGVVASKILSDPLPPAGRGKGFTWLPSIFPADRTMFLLRTSLAAPARQGMDCNGLLENCCVTYNVIFGPAWGGFESGIRVPCGTLTQCIGQSGNPERLPNPGKRIKLNFLITYKFADSQLIHSRNGNIATTVQAPP